MKEDLIIKFLSGECTEEELKQIRVWLKDPLFKKEFDHILRSRFEKQFLAEDSIAVSKGSLDKIFKNIRKEIDHKENRLPVKYNMAKDLEYNFLYYSKLVACFLIFPFTFFILHTYYNLNSYNNSDEYVSEIQVISKSVQTGEKLKIKLPDGSLVILNSGSTLEYPELFSDSLRMVNLTGEAYFEVVSDKSKPFKVITDGAITTVLGTFFNIKSREGVAEIALTEGKVKVEAENKNNVVLLPGEMAIADIRQEKIAIEEFNIEEVTSWKNGIIVFKNLPLSEVFLNLENWYGVKININKGIKLNRKVSGEFNNENLDNVLAGLSFSFNFKYQLTGKEVSIFK